MEKLYTYTIITTSSNEQLRFLHDRMPVILENGSEDIRTWLDPKRAEWSKELQSLLRPYKGELECYPVSKDVGKVGNNSPTFMVPISSTENKSNIANFFGNAKKSAKGKEEKNELEGEEAAALRKAKVEADAEEKRITVDEGGIEDNAPLPVPGSEIADIKSGVKRERSEDNAEELAGSRPTPTKVAKKSKSFRSGQSSPAKASGVVSTRKSRSATSNGSKSSPTKATNDSQKITKFFN